MKLADRPVGAVLKSPVKQSINNIRRTPVFSKSGGTGKQLAQDFSSFKRTLVAKNNRLTKASNKNRLPTNKQIDRASLQILRQLQNSQGGGMPGMPGIPGMGGLGMLGGGLLDLGLGAVDLASGLFDRGAKKGAQKGVQKGAQKAATKGATKATTKATTKAATKAAGRGIGKGLLKKLPLVGLGLGAAFALERAANGDMLGAFGELASGAAAMVPGWGTAASVAIDAGLAAKDINEANNSQNKIDEKLDKKRDEGIKTKVRGQGGLMPALDKFEIAVENFKTSFMRGSFNQDIAPGTATDSMGSKNPNMHSGEYPGFDTMERVAPFVTGHVSTYPGAQFGASRDGGNRTHLGQDIDDQDPGDPVLSVMKGTVTEVGNGFRFQNGQGRSQTIGIQHPDGTMSRYVHVLSNVSVGDEVLTGQKIGTVSPADVASSKDFPHLHFELYAKGGGVIDPRPFLNSAPKGTPSVAPIAANGDTKIQPERDGADDRESAPMLTVGDSIAEGVKGDGAGKAKRGANPTQVLDMLKTQDLAGKTLRLSSGISNNTSQLNVVRQQLEYARSQGVSSVQLMGTSNDREDLAAMNPKLQALVKEFPGLVKFGGGFKSTDLIHPDYSQYRQRLDNLVKSPGLEAQSMLNYEIPTLEAYPTYNQEGGSPTFIIMDSGGQTPPPPEAPAMPSRSSSQSRTSVVVMGGGLNKAINELLLTKLSKS